MEEAAARRSDLSDAAVVHEERISLEPGLDGVKPGLSELPGFFASAVLHDAEVAPSSSVPLTGL